MTIAVVFPGQGSQTAGFGLPWNDHPAITIVDRAETAVDVPLRHLVLDPDADLGGTRDAQLSVLLGSLIVWEALQPVLDRTGIRPVAHSGHSLGQITALLSTATLSFPDGLALAVARAEASAAAQRQRPGALLALLGTDEDRTREICDALDGRAWIANLNGGGQIIVGTAPEHTAEVADAARAAGVRRVRPLEVDGAFHTPLMQPAADALTEPLAALRFRTPTAPLVTNHDAAAVTDETGWPERLRTHLIRPVRWEDCIHRLIALGATHLVEVGPGRTLTGLARRIAPDLPATSIQTPEDLDTFETLLDDLVVGVAR